MRRTPWLAAMLTLLVAAAPAGAAEETWVDDTGGGQGVEFTRDISRTHVPRFHDMRPATFSCTDGTGYDDPLVVVSAGDAAGSDLPVAIASDG